MKIRFLKSLILAACSLLTPQFSTPNHAAEPVSTPPIVYWQKPISNSQKLVVFRRKFSPAEKKRQIQKDKEEFQKEHLRHSKSGWNGLSFLVPDDYFDFTFVLASKDGKTRNQLWVMHLIDYHPADWPNELWTNFTLFDVSYDTQSQVLVVVYKTSGTIDAPVISVSEKGTNFLKWPPYKSLPSIRDEDDIHFTSATIQGSVRQANVSLIVHNNQKESFKFLWKNNDWVKIPVSAPKNSG